MQEHVILVDSADQQIGIEDKLKAHQHGKLHRAFSIFLFNNRGEMLLQQRSLHKYHSGGLWSNACCSHPQPDETVMASAQRRLLEEVGVICPLQPLFRFEYRAEVGPGLIEHELDQVLLGFYDGPVIPNRHEVQDYRWLAITELQDEIAQRPQDFTVWFRLIADRVIAMHAEHAPPAIAAVPVL